MKCLARLIKAESLSFNMLLDDMTGWAWSPGPGAHKGSKFTHSNDSRVSQFYNLGIDQRLQGV